MTKSPSVEKKKMNESLTGAVIGRWADYKPMDEFWLYRLLNWTREKFL